MPYLPIIGLEIHVQLKTASKMFCACDAQYFGADPNTHTCPVCLGLPGALPVANEKAVEQTVRVGLALNSTIPEQSKFDRKNYFYPDLAKGYQISQYDQPLCVDGHLDVELSDGTTKRIGITRAHLEEDTGKSQHEKAGGEDYTLLDFNKCGVPLLEIVSEPDMRSVEEASAYARKVRQIVRYIDASDADMEKGQLRFDVNVSVGVLDGEEALRPQSSDGAQQASASAKATADRQAEGRLPEKHTPIVEIKNLNSFRYLEKAIAYEIQRQINAYEQTGELSESGNKETRGWDMQAEETVFQRSKEEAHDYRYFPEPDLPPLKLERAWIDQLAEALPELPEAKVKRFVEAYGLKLQDASSIAAERLEADWYEQAVGLVADQDEQKAAQEIAKWLTGDITYWLRENETTLLESKLTPALLAEFIELLLSGKINSKIAKQILPTMLQEGISPKQIVQDQGLEVVSDSSSLDPVLEEVIQENPEVVEQIKGGKESAIMFLVGQVMKKTRGQADPPTVQGMLKGKILG